MNLTKIEIEDYKSIKSPVTIAFSDSLPTILIGKNGSGKTNILEALMAISMANSNFWGYRGEELPIYRAYIQLSEDDMAAMLPDAVYDKQKCEVVAYSTGKDLKINKVRSEYITPLLKKEISDVRDLATQLQEALDVYEKQLIKISHEGYDESPVGCCEVKFPNGRLTSYDCIHWSVEDFIKRTRENIAQLLKPFDDEQTFAGASLEFAVDSRLFWVDDHNPQFVLEYVEPQLAKFEEKFVSINKRAIKREITKINKATKESCDRIQQLIGEIQERTERLKQGLCSESIVRPKKQERYYEFLRQIQHAIGNRCSFLKSENAEVLFKKQSDNPYYYTHSNLIAETYLRQVYQGRDRDELLAANKKASLSQQAVAEFEAFLNQNIPDFEKDMYQRISVQTDQKGEIAIFLIENSGAQVNLNETSAGRRWYFTYYFMKNTLSKGDVFIIDEPAAMLHPSAQREVREDLMELSRRGVKVVYSTHSPYLIPEESPCVQFVTMTDDGTKVSNTSSNQDLLDQISKIVGEDIFDIQTIVDLYVKGDPTKTAKNCYKALKNYPKPLEDIAQDLAISVDTIKSWGRNAHNKSPKLENVVLVAKYTKIDIKDLLN